jgi:hypothetical protein
MMILAAAAAVVLFGVDATDAKRPYIEPIAIVERRGERRKYSPPPSPDKDQKAFAREYFGGRRYEVFSSGEPMGTAFAQSRVEIGCVSLAAGAKLSKRLPYSVGLATSGPLITQHRDTTREVTPDEQAALEALLREKLRINYTRDVSIVAADFDHDGRPEFVASGDVKAGRIEHQFLVIATANRGRMRIEYVYDHTKDPQNENDTESIELFDQADIDDDGVDEIVLRLRGYEDWNWQILKRAGRKWKVVYRGGGGGC